MAITLTDAVRSAVEESSHHGLPACAALATLVAFPGEPLDALARTLRLSAAGASRLADRLQADGLLERKAGASDGRSRALVLTAAGRKAAGSVLAARRAVVLRALAPLSANQRDQLSRSVELMLTALTPDRETCDYACRLCDVAACPQDVCPIELAALRTEE